MSYRAACGVRFQPQSPHTVRSRHLLKATVLIFLAYLTITACAGHLVDPAARRLELARERLATAKWRQAFALLELDLTSLDPPSRERATTLVNTVTQFVPGLLEELRADVWRLDTSAAAMDLKQQIDALARTGLTSQAHVDALLATLNAHIAEANRAGTISFTFADAIENFPSLRDDPAIATIFEHSLHALQQGSSAHRPLLVEKTFEFVKAKGTGSTEHRRLEQVLPTIKFSKRELEAFVKPLYPAFAEETLKALMVVVHLTTDPQRRLLEEDIKTGLLARSDLLTIVREAQPRAITVVVRELQFEERQFPERTQTVVVPYGAHDLSVAILALPRNASTVFEYAQGGAEINWAFELVASKDGQVLYERVLRDSVRRDYHFCSNLRVVNIFGGVQAALAYPNQQVKQVCETGQQPVGVSALRPVVVSRLVEEISGIPLIAEAIRRSR